MLNPSWLKVFTFFAMWAVVWLPIAVVISQFTNWRLDRTLTPQQKLVFLASLYILIPAVIGWKIKVESLSFANLGLSLVPNIMISILLGLILAVISLTIVFFLETCFSLVSWHRQNIKDLLPIILPILILSLLISLVEELVFRGYVFSTLLSDSSYWLAATISSLIFAILHLIWERKETFPQIPGLWLMGMVLVMARLVDNNNIYLALGLHAGWIWGLTCIDSAKLITYNHQGSWLTGINHQPLAGVAGIFCLTITGLALWLMANSRLLW